MFRNYFKLAWRNLWKHKVLSFINMGSLVIGISAALVIYMIVLYDSSFDKFEKDGDRIYRVVSDLNFSGTPFKTSGTPVPLSRVAGEVPGVELSSFFSIYNGDLEVTIPGAGAGKVFKKQEGAIFADSSYFRLISYKWLAGSDKQLNEPGQLVLAESAARKYFPGLPAAGIIGKEVVYNDSIITRVVGVVADIEENTDFTFTAFISYKTGITMRLWDDYMLNKWGNTNSISQLFLKLHHGVSPQKVAAGLMALHAKNDPPEPGSNSSTTYVVQPLSDLHFSPYYDNFDQRKASQSTLLGLQITAVFLLLLGIINFVNLQTAQAGNRAREIGVRKVMGSSKAGLIRQFLGESLLLTVLATICSIALAPVVLKLFGSFIPEGVTFGMVLTPKVVMFLLSLILVVSLLAGFYPALVLSRFEPVTVLKGRLTGGSGRSWFRQALTVSQFTVALVFIMATIIVARQTRYGLSKELGYRKDAIIHGNANYMISRETRAAFAERLRQVPGIAMVGRSNQPPGSPGTNSSNVSYLIGKEKQDVNVQFKFADTNYLNVYRLQLLAGRNLLQSDTVREFIINETMAHMAGYKYPQQAIGQVLTWNDKPMPIVGVVKDFHQKSLKEEIRPVIIASNVRQYYGYDILLQPGTEGNWQAAIGSMEKLAREMFVDYEFSYKFFDEEIAAFYKYEKSLSSLLAWAMGLMILISCLGLLGLSIHTTSQRTKEIGIRKILGASVAGIVALFTKDVLRLVLIAVLLATPVAWYAMYKWLEGYAYNIGIQWWVFVAAGAGAILIGLLTVSFHSLKAALMNPVRSLRAE